VLNVTQTREEDRTVRHMKHSRQRPVNICAH